MKNWDVLAFFSLLLLLAALVTVVAEEADVQVPAEQVEYEIATPRAAPASSTYCAQVMGMRTEQFGTPSS